MRILGIVLAALILLIQGPLWFGKGGWLRVWEVEQQVEAQQAKNEKLEQRNALLAAEVRDLKQGTDAIEERARFELGMIREGEVFVQIVAPQKPAASPGEPAGVPPKKPAAGKKP